MPTPEAIELSKAVDRSFSSAEAIFRQAEAIGGTRTNQLRILTMPALAHSFLPLVIARFLVGRPDLKISIDVQRSEAIAGWSSIESFDVGFSMLPIHRHGVETHLFDEARAVCVMRSDHSLANEMIIRPKDLENVDIVSGGPLTFGNWQQNLDTKMADTGSAFIVKVETPISAIACELVAQGVGVALLDHFVAHSFQNRGW